MRIAVLLTCFNRKELTLRCLGSLKAIHAYDCDVFLVDDNSTDGTAEAVAVAFPDVHILKGNGNLFWNRGMHLAWSAAAKGDYDFYLWLNDDISLYENALDELFCCSKQKQHRAVISGIIESKDKTKILYGGTNSKGLITANGKMNAISLLNGNAVLIPRYAYKILGNLDPTFHHDLGDVDYGLRAKKEGVEVCTSRVPVAYGTANSISRVRKSNLSVFERFQALNSPLGSPLALNFHFRKRHYGVLHAVAFVAHLIIINLMSDRVVSLFYGNKYCGKISAQD